jgi:citrate lyase gamma subunit
MDFNTKILIIGTHTNVYQIAKNLLSYDIKIDIYDNEIIVDKDYETNLFLKNTYKKYIGQNKSKIIKQYLKDINIKSNLDNLNSYDLIITVNKLNKYNINLKLTISLIIFYIKLPLILRVLKSSNLKHLS